MDGEAIRSRPPLGRREGRPPAPPVGSDRRRADAALNPRRKKCDATRRRALAAPRVLLCCAAMEIGPLRERVSKLQSRLTVLRGHL